MSKKKVSHIATDSNDSDNCIVLDTGTNSSICESPLATNRSPSIFFISDSKSTKQHKSQSVSNDKHIFQSFVTEPYFLSHERQFSSEDTEFLAKLNTAKYEGKFELKTEQENAFKIDNIHLKEGLNLEFKWDNEPVNNSCDCQKVI